MKKINLLVVFIFVVQFVFAQNAISGYSFYQTIDEYEEIAGGTVLELQYPTWNPGGAFFYKQDEGITDPIDIGFTFTYGGEGFTQFRTSANGYLSIGDADFTQFSGHINDLDETQYRYVAPIKTDLILLFEDDPNAFISYKLGGEVGNQVLTVQFQNLRSWNDNNWPPLSMPALSWQIKLYELNNKIEFVYDDMSGALGWNFGYIGSSCGISDQGGLPDGTYLSVMPGYPCELSDYQVQNWVYESVIATILEGTTYSFVPVQEYDAMALSIDINENLQYNEAVVPTATFENHGSETATFDVTIEIINSDQAIVYDQTETITEIAAGNTQQISFSPDWTAEAGDFTVKIFTTLIGDTYIENDTLIKNIEVSYLKKAYCYVRWSESGIYPTGPSWFYLEEPDEINNIAPADESINNGAWAEGKWYSIQYDPNQLVYFDTETGSKTVVGATNAGVTVFYGLSYDWSTNTMYAITGYEDLQLYTIDLLTGAATLVGTASSFPAKFHTLACDIDGNLFSVCVDGNLYSINKTTAEHSLIGPLNLPNSVSPGGQDIEFDHYSGNLYWYGILTGGNTDAMYIINTTTGEATATSNFFDYQVQFCGFAIPYEPETTFSVTFDITDDLEPEVTLNEYGTQTATGGTTTFTGVEPAQSPGILYTAQLEGYQTYTGYVVVDNNEAVSITLTALSETYDVTFNISGGLEPEITLGNYGTFTATGGTYTFTDVYESTGQGILYSVELDGYQTVVDYLIVDGDETVDITLVITSIQNIENNIFEIYPNPSNGILNILGSNRAGEGLLGLEITDITGQIIYTRGIVLNDMPSDVPLQIDLSNKPKGVYFLTIKTETGVYTDKLIIQ